jgi:hypothetical protein
LVTQLNRGECANERCGGKKIAGELFAADDDAWMAPQGKQRHDISCAL